AVSDHRECEPAAGPDSNTRRSARRAAIGAGTVSCRTMHGPPGAQAWRGGATGRGVRAASVAPAGGASVARVRAAAGRAGLLDDVAVAPARTRRGAGRPGARPARVCACD